MAKVFGPLFSFDAKCTIAKAITFMRRGKTLFVRVVFKPVQSLQQKHLFQNLVHGGCSKMVARIERGWRYHQAMPKQLYGGADFQAQTIGMIKTAFFNNEQDLQDLWLTKERHPQHSQFYMQAKKRYFQDLLAPWWEPKWTFDRGFQLYMLGRFAIHLRETKYPKFNFWPYNKGIADWNATDVSAHAQIVRQL